MIQDWRRRAELPCSDGASCRESCGGGRLSAGGHSRRRSHELVQPRIPLARATRCVRRSFCPFIASTQRHSSSPRRFIIQLSVASYSRTGYTGFFLHTSRVEANPARGAVSASSASGMPARCCSPSWCWHQFHGTNICCYLCAHRMVPAFGALSHELEMCMELWVIIGGYG